MSTVFRIQVDSPPSNAENVIRQAFEEVERLETVLSEWREDSDISKVNSLAGKKAVKVGDDTLRVVDAGMDVSMWSRGAFDLSWAALWGLYDFRPDSIKGVLEETRDGNWDRRYREGLCPRPRWGDSPRRWRRQLHDLWRRPSTGPR
jgi:thiamine biosynthesis lipoprotein ApbE